MTWNATYVGAMLIATGVFLGLWRRKRVFDRTNAYGLERFPTYRSKLGTKAKDGALTVSSISLLTIGLLVLAKDHEDSWGWVILLPAYVLGFCLLPIRRWEL